MNYYEEMFKKLQSLIDEGKNREALVIIKEELAVPYIPQEEEKKLKQLYNDLSQDSYSKELNDEKIEEFLFGDAEHQLLAVNALCYKNLRDYLPICNRYLCAKAYINAKVLLIDALIRQEISENVKMKEQGIDYDFIPRYILLPEESDGFESALKIIEEHYLKEPAKAIIAKDLLYKDCLLALPISYTIEEGSLLAYKITTYVDKCFDQEEK